MKLKTVRLICIIMLGILIAIPLLVALIKPAVTETTGVIAIVIMAVLIIAGFIFCGIFWCCPHCRRGLGRLYKYQFCSHCGAKLDI